MVFPVLGRRRGGIRRIQRPGIKPLPLRIEHDQIEIVDEGNRGVLHRRRVVPYQSELYRTRAFGHLKEILVGRTIGDQPDEKSLLAQLLHSILDLYATVAGSEVRPFVIPARLVVQVTGRVYEQ